MGPDLEKTPGKKLVEFNSVQTCVKMQSNPLVWCVLNAKANTTVIILASFACWALKGVSFLWFCACLRSHWLPRFSSLTGSPDLNAANTAVESKRQVTKHSTVCTARPEHHSTDTETTNALSHSCVDTDTYRVGMPYQSKTGRNIIHTICAKTI